MKKSFQFFVWIILLIAGLMVVLVITQINSSRSIDRLVLGNKQAAATMVVNNRLEEMVNFSFELEAKLLTEKPPYTFDNQSGVKDSIARLTQKAGQLEKIMVEEGISSSLKKIVILVSRQSTLSSAIVASGQKQPLLDSLRNQHFGDSIYSNALAFQIEMEQTLRYTLKENNKEANRVSWLNRILAITAIAAILLLGTIIIRRQLIQFILIKDLEQARKVALQSVKIKDQFLANMSHEIRTPLNALKGFSRLLSKTNLDKEQQQFTRIINSSSESLLHIVNDILDLSKLEAGAWSVKNTKFNLHTLLKDLELTYSTLAKEKNLNFALLIALDVENKLLGDPQRLRQILMNLISNAIKFTTGGGVNLTVKTSSKNYDAISLQFAVTDTGIGIPADKQELIFERFEQLDNSFVRTQGGTGLGLSITKMIVESLGGKIKVDSEPGKGSVFSFTVQFTINRQPDAEPETPVALQNNYVTDVTRKEVLLAEDNKVNQLLIQKILAPFNIQPVVADNGQQVIDLLEKQHFDLVLMDVQMPIMDGITATGLIRNNLKKNVPVIGMTAYVQPNEIKKCYDAGMNEFVPKPIEEPQFLTVIKKYIYLQDRLQPEPADAMATTATDFGFLEKICNGNKADMDLILETMLAELPKECSSLDEALFQKDAKAVRGIMHHLKSTLSPMGTDTAIAKSLTETNYLFTAEKDWLVLEQAGKRFSADLKDYVSFLKNRRKFILI
jgi:signal transduction histidine kinase/CheY-like chemotaxis protein